MTSGRIVTKSEWTSLPFDISVFEKSGTADLIGFEELTDYEIIRDGDSKGTKRKKLKVKDKKKKKKKKTPEKEEDGEDSDSVEDVPPESVEVDQSDENDEPKKKKKKQKKTKKHDDLKKPQPTAEESTVIANEFVEDSEPELEFESGSETEETAVEDFELDDATSMKMLEWNKLFVPLPIMRALAEMKFYKPTPIQSMVLPAAIRGRRDVVGAAETGSGKTLAFGIPIINGILDDKKYEQDLEDAAVLDAEYDRETAEAKLASGQPDSPQAEQEQEGEEEEEAKVEQTDAKPSKPVKKLRALILTPTRELAVQVRNHLVAIAKYTGIHVAVLIGGMALPKQERILKKGPEIVVATPGRLWELINEGNVHLSNLEDIRYLAIDETDRMLEKGHFRELEVILSQINADPDKKARRQNFVLSATLTIVHDLPERLKEQKKKKSLTSDQKLNAIMEHIGVKSKAKVVDITNKSFTSDTLTETQIPCTNEEKDYYLFYILKQHPGRTLVFCNSIDCVRRLTSVLNVLNCKPLPIHAQMHQKQRLKNLERFSADEKGVLIATDVAARGLDVPNIQHVVHYQVPRTSESYVHRSGRTARASREGISVVLVEPSEYTAYQKMCKTLGRTKDLPDFPVDVGVFSAVKQTVNMGRDYEKLEHRYKKQQSEKNWFKKMAEEADLVLDEDDDDRRKESQEDNHDKSDISKDLKAKRRQLEGLLKQKLVPRGTSIIYPAASVENMRKIKDTETGKDALHAVKKSTSAISKKRKNKSKKKKKPSVNK